MLTRNHQQEALCRAYVQAVAALAGVATSTPTPDYGIDLSLRRIEQHENQRRDEGVQLDLQLRSSTRAEVTDTEIKHDLDVRTYDLLRTTPPVPRVLVLLVLPTEEQEWLSQSTEELIVRRCAYWLSLRRSDPTDSSSTIRVALPRSQVFSVEAVQDLLERIAQGEMP
jgi:hypothetical protein